MHSNKINNTQFHYNSDMSGEVIILSGNQEVVVKGSDLIEFVLNRLRDEKISRLEQLDNNQLKEYMLFGLR